MNMRKLLDTINFTLFLLLILGRLSAQDYQSRQLQKDLRKSLKLDKLELNTLFNTDKEVDLSALSGQFFVVSGEEKTNLAYVYNGRVFSCRTGGCTHGTAQNPEQESEYFDYYILFDTLGKVTHIRVYNYAATHGQEVTARNWLKQFYGFEGQQTLTVGKDIDAISGATISVYAITADIEYQTKQLHRFLGLPIP